MQIHSMCGAEPYKQFLDAGPYKGFGMPNNEILPKDAKSKRKTEILK